MFRGIVIEDKNLAAIRLPNSFHFSFTMVGIVHDQQDCPLDPKMVYVLSLVISRWLNQDEAQLNNVLVIGPSDDLNKGPRATVPANKDP